MSDVHLEASQAHCSKVRAKYDCLTCLAVASCTSGPDTTAHTVPHNCVSAIVQRAQIAGISKAQQSRAKHMCCCGGCVRAAVIVRHLTDWRLLAEHTSHFRMMADSNAEMMVLKLSPFAFFSLTTSPT